MKPRNVIGLTSLLCCLFSNIALGQTAVIVHPNNQQTLSEQDIRVLYLGQTRAFPNGQLALPIQQSLGSDERSHFIEKVLKKQENQFRSYWAKLSFTGQGIPPSEVRNDSEMKQLVRNNPAVVGYINSQSIDKTVRVVFIIE